MTADMVWMFIVPVAQWIMFMAIFLLGFGIMHMIGKGNV